MATRSQALTRTISFFGGSGNDRFYCSAGADTYNGGSGTDTVDYTNAGIGLTIREVAGKASVSAAGVVSDKLISVENIIGSSKGDFIEGSSAKNFLDGGRGSDKLFGKAGADTLVGGQGNDILTGGSGADRFVFNNGHGKDIITDFQAGIDSIDVRGILTVDDYQTMVKHHDVYESGDDVVLDFGKGDQVTLKGVCVSDLCASDFLF